MSSSFTPPEIGTKHLRGPVELVPSFQIAVQLEPRETEHTMRGERIHQRVTGGTITGPRLTGTVYPSGGGEFGVIRSDGTEEWFTRLMLRASNGEWLYTHLTAYVRDDGYARFQAIFDADRQGPHGWLNESMFIGTIVNAPDGLSRTMTYYEAT